MDLENKQILIEKKSENYSDSENLAINKSNSASEANYNISNIYKNTNDNYPYTGRKTIAISLNRYGKSYAYPGSELLAKTHSKTFRLGEFNKSYERVCECCNGSIPVKYFDLQQDIKSIDLQKWGIDLCNFFYVMKFYYKFLIYFFFTYLLQFTLCLVIYNVPNVKFEILYIEMYYSLILSNGQGPMVISACFDLVRLGLLYSLFLKLITGLKIKLRKYRKTIYDTTYVDESIFAIFIKNLPHVIDKEHFKKFLIDNYELKSIREIIYLKDSEKIIRKYEKLAELTSLKKKMEVTRTELNSNYTLEEFQEVENNILILNNKLNKMISEKINENTYSGTAIVIFEKCEEKNLFFRKNFNLGIYMFCNCRKPSVYKGKKIFFESCPSLDHIDWKYISFSLEKNLCNSGFNSELAISVFFVFSYIIFIITLLCSLLNSIEIFNVNILQYPFVKALFLLFVNMGIQILIELSLSTFSFADKYFKNILIRYIVMQKTIFNTIVINLFNYQQKLSSGFEDKYFSFIYFVILIAVKSIFFTRFSETYIAKRFKYFIMAKIQRKKFVQYEINDFLSDNEFDVLKVFEKFRLLVLTALVIMKVYPLCSVFLTVLIFCHYYIIKYSLFHSCLRNINYNGYYFNLIMRVELINLILVIFIFNAFLYLNFNSQTILLPNSIYIFLSDFFFIFYFKMNSNYSKAYKDYNEYESKFKSKFSQQKFVDLNLLKKEFEHIENTHQYTEEN